MSRKITVGVRTEADNDGYTFADAPISTFDSTEELYNDFGEADSSGYCENDAVTAVLIISVISSVGLFNSRTGPERVICFIADGSFFIISVKPDLT